MSDKPNDGGPAFPSGDGQWSGGTNHVYGMTLRDWFAGQALAHRYTTASVESEEWETCEEAARWAYMLADAMLDARTKGGGA